MHPDSGLGQPCPRTCNAVAACLSRHHAASPTAALSRRNCRCWNAHIDGKPGPPNRRATPPPATADLHCSEDRTQMRTSQWFASEATGLATGRQIAVPRANCGGQQPLCEYRRLIPRWHMRLHTGLGSGGGRLLSVLPSLLLCVDRRPLDTALGVVWWRSPHVMPAGAGCAPPPPHTHHGCNAETHGGAGGAKSSPSQRKKGHSAVRRAPPSKDVPVRENAR